MVNENIDESIPSTDSTEKKSLLEKYDIEINKLDFGYVEKCKDVKELEKIVKILRSGEEGHYKELQQRAEDRLRALAPKSRVLRKEEPVIRKESMMPEEREIFDTEMKEWEKTISSKDEELTDWNKNYTQDSSSGDYMLPPVRRAPQSKADKNKQQSINKKTKKPGPSDYTTWDKYDAESEILKMEAEEERVKQDKEMQLRKQKAAVEAEYKRKEHSRLDDIIKMAQSMPDAEKSSLALSEKDRGNEYYKTCNYDDAISYYSASVAIHPSAVAYNNRAACYLKQGKYDLALSDCNKCLELDPENAKGLYRRGLCLQHKNQFDEALQDMQSVLRKEPHNLLVQHVAKELRQQCRSVPKSVRMLVEEQDDKMVEISEAEAKGRKDGYEINEWGLARNMCNCCRVPPFLRTINDSGIAENLIYKPENDDDKKMKKKKFIEKELAKANKPDNVNNNEPIIETICNGNTDNGIETSRIVYGSNVDNDELIPKKIKIIETIKSPNNPNVTNVREKQPKKCNVKDMRGQSHVHGQQQTSEMTEQFENIKLGEPSSTNTATTTKPTAQNKSGTKSRKSKHKHQSNNNNNNNNNNDDNNQEANERNNQSQQIRPTVRNYEFNGLSERQPINVASKYTTQKVASAKNINNNYKNKKDILPNNINNSPSDGNTNFYESINPYQFFSLWTSIKESSTSLQEYANILRRISPSSIHKLLGNKLDGTMLTAMLKTLANEFDVTNNEAELVKQYLVSLSNAERFQINVQFLNEDMKQMICGLIDKVGGDDKNSLKESYLVV